MESEHFVAKIAQKVIIQKDTKILLVRESLDPLASWELPGGRLNKNELPEQGVQREIKEELGVEIILKGLVHIGVFVHPKEGDHLTIVYSAELKNLDQEFVIDKKEIADTKWITRSQLYEQPIWKDILDALEVFFKVSDK